MGAYLTLVRRELGGLFLSLSGYVAIGVVVFLLGLSFAQLLAALNGVSTERPLTELFYSTMFFWLIVLLVTPMITMRTFAQEKESGTFEALMTTPVSDLQVVLAKFTGAWLFYTIAWLPLLACLVVARHFAQEPLAFDPRVTATTFLGIVLLGGVFISTGVLASSLTKSQIVAGMVSFAAGAGYFVLSFFIYALPAKAGWQAAVLAHISMFEHMQDFVRGVVDTRHLVFYLTTTVFFLFLTLKAVESRRWK